MDNDYKEKAIKVIKDSIEKIDGVLAELSTGKKGSNISAEIWKILAELEYAASVLSIIYGLMNFNPNLNNNLNDFSLGHILVKSQDLLYEALKDLKTDPKRAYIKLRNSINSLKQAQSRIE